MTLVTGLTRECAHVATVVRSASVAAWSRRPTIQWPDRTAQELVRLDAGFRTSLRTQLESARRYDRRFTLTSTELDGVDPALDPVQVAQACERHIRVLDAVTLRDGVVVLLWGNTEQTEAAAALDRLITSGVLPPTSLERTGAATFPIDGLTAVSLSAAAADHIGALAPSRREHSNRPHDVSPAPAWARAANGSSMNGDELAAVGR